MIVICYLLFKEIKKNYQKKVHCSLNFSVRQRFDKVILTWYGIKRSCLITLLYIPYYKSNIDMESNVHVS